MTMSHIRFRSLNPTALSFQEMVPLIPPDSKAVKGLGDELAYTNQDVENEETSKVVQLVNGLDNMAQEVEDKLAKCELANDADEDEAAVIRTFHKIVREYFRGPLKPPFNKDARKAAGFEPAWYEPLAVKEVYVDEDTVE